MEVYREGLKEYLKDGDVGNDYFYKVEYHMLQRNRIASFVPMQVREEDKNKALLYDISGLALLSDKKQEAVFSEEDCRSLLRQIALLLKNVEEYMLMLSHISFNPQEIYVDDDDQYHWLYQPGEEFDYSDQLRSLWAWVMEHIDYENRTAVEFSYHVFRMMRKQVMSREVLERCLNYEVKRNISYTEFFAEEKPGGNQGLGSNESQMQMKNAWQEGSQGISLSQNQIQSQGIGQGGSYGRNQRNDIGIVGAERSLVDTAMNPYSYMVYDDTAGKKEKKKKAGAGKQEWFSLVLEGILAILALAMAGGMIWFFYQGMEQKLMAYYMRYGLACLVLFLLLLFGIVQIHRIGKSDKDTKESDKNKVKEPLWETERENAKEPLWETGRENAKEPLWENGRENAKEPLWETGRENVKASFGESGQMSWDAIPEERTTLLNDRVFAGGNGSMDQATMKKACFRDLDTGEVFPLMEFPLFIGKDARTCGLVLQDETVSRKHAVITRNERGGEYFIEDLNSRNGTMVDQARILPGNRYPLSDGGSISISRKEFQFVFI